MSSFSKQMWVVLPLNPSKVFSAPPFRISVTTDSPPCSPKNQVIPPKILRLPLPSVINNDQSLSFSSLIAHETSRTHTYCHVSFKKGIPNRVLQSINPEPKFRAIPYSWWFYSASPPSTPTQSLNPGSRPEFAWKSRIPSFKWGKSRIPKIVWGHSYWLSVRAHEKQQPLVWFILN